MSSTYSERAVPLVSALVPVYNAQKFLRGALENLEGQTIANNLEIIIIETGSQTDELSIVRDFQERFNNIIYLRTSSRENAPAAVNRGIRIASGKYVTPANSDDRHREDAFEIMVQELETHPEVALVYGDNFATKFENQTFAKHIRCGYKLRPDYSPAIMLSGCHMGPQPMWRRAIHDEIGILDETLESAGDYEFWCRIAQRYPLRHIPRFMGVYYDNPSGIVNSNKTRNLEQARLIQERYQAVFPAPAHSYHKNFDYMKPVSPGKFVNIGMVTFNRLEFTKAAITSILEFTCFPHVLTVVDNGSTDGTVEYLKAMKQEGIITNLLLLNENFGVAKASNLAWSQEPDAEYYVKFDNDIVIEKPNWLTKMVEVIEAVPELGMVAYNFEPNSYPTCSIRGKVIRPKKGNLGGACILVPQRTHQTFGYWCEDYGLYGEEDADYGMRIMLGGLHNAYLEDEVIGVHLPAGRAAQIDPITSQAQDGREEYEYAEYRQFKDRLRHENKRGLFSENLRLYQSGKKSLYCPSIFVERHQKGILHKPSVQIQVAQPDFTPVSLAQGLTKTGSHRRVSVIVNDQFCGGLRLLYPLQDCIEKLNLMGQVLIETDIWKGKAELPMGVHESIVVQRMARFIEPRLPAVKAQGTRIVYDLDDLLWKIPEDNQNHQVITGPMLDCLFRIMAHADCVTVSTEPLQAAVAALGLQAVLLPNCLFEEQWTALGPRRRVSSRPRVGWVGQVGVHRDDVAILASVVEMLEGEVEWVFLGEIPEIKSGVRFEAETHAMVPLQDFPRKLASLNLDLALAPLAMNEFNEAKSDLRILQYGILGYPVVATDIFPYRSAPVTRVPNDAKAWAQAIRDHIHNRDASEVQGQTLKQWVLAHRMFQQWASHYQAAWLGEPISAEGVSMGANDNVCHHPIAHLSSKESHMAFDCSIIIPLFNRVDLTKQCLTKLAEVTQGPTFEVILVDNASTDETPAFCQSLSGDVHTIRNVENVGFAKACNQGAAKAKGRYLVFLNNDTIPLEGWLSALLNEAEQHPEVAIVGSKLLFPDQTIQHAGVVFSKNCLIPYHIFRGESAQLSAANARREFQAVTAACMLVRREDWERVGGFDEGYRNGFEDVDLCLKMRERGRLVIYQPLSVLYHLEHQTPGRKNPEAENHNGRLLMDRWASKIIPDEDVYYVPEGYGNRWYVQDGMMRQRLSPFKDEREKQQWQRVAQVQKLLLQMARPNSSDSQKPCPTGLEVLLSEPEGWPDDLECLRWGAQLCRTWELPVSEAGFWRRVLIWGNDPMAREYLAKYALKQNDLTEAGRHVSALVESYPNEGMGYGLQGILLMQTKQYEPAREAFRRALGRGFDARKAGMGLGMASMGMGEFGQAWDTFQEVLATHPDDQELVNGLLQAGTLLERWEELRDLLTRFLERNPANRDIRFALAGVCYRSGKIEEAMTQYEFMRNFFPEYEGLDELGQQLQDASASHLTSSQEVTSSAPATLFDSQMVRAYYQPPLGNTEKYVRVLPRAVVGHTIAGYQFLKEYEISGCGSGIAGVEKMLSMVFQRQFSQAVPRPCDMWDRVVALTLDCELVHGINGQSFRILQPKDLEDIDVTFAQQEGEVRKREIAAYLNKMRTGECLGMPLYISGKILNYLGASAKDQAMYMLDGARRLSACALNHQERVQVVLLAFEEEFARLLRDPVKRDIQDGMQQLAWFQNYHSIPFLGMAGQRSLKRFKLMEAVPLLDSVIIDFGCNLGQASLKALQLGAREVWGIEGMQDTLAMAEKIKTIAGCHNLHYLHMDFNNPQFDRLIDQAIPLSCDYAFFFSVYRTKELTQRDRLFQYILQKTSKGVFFEGHAHPKIDTIEYYEWLFETVHVPYTFLGYSEEQIRPLFYLNLAERFARSPLSCSPSSVALPGLPFSETWSKQNGLVTSRS